MGVMDIDPLRLLEDGIRLQIGARIARTATAALSFQQRRAACDMPHPKVNLSNCEPG
jgi:hypothetical protein